MTPHTLDARRPTRDADRKLADARHGMRSRSTASSSPPSVCDSCSNGISSWKGYRPLRRHDARPERVSASRSGQGKLTALDDRGVWRRSAVRSPRRSRRRHPRPPPSSCVCARFQPQRVPGWPRAIEQCGQLPARVARQERRRSGPSAVVVCVIDAPTPADDMSSRLSIHRSQRRRSHRQKPVERLDCGSSTLSFGRDRRPPRPAGRREDPRARRHPALQHCAGTEGACACFHWPRVSSASSSSLRWVRACECSVSRKRVTKSG